MNATLVEAPAETPLAITISPGPITNPQGTRHALVPTSQDPGPETVLARLLEQAPGRVESWWSAHTWRGDHRRAENWEVAVASVVDLDFLGDPEWDEERARWKQTHSEPPAFVREQLEQAVQEQHFNGSLFHLTPRGARFIFLLEHPITDAEFYSRVMDGACADIHSSLVRLGLSAELDVNGCLVRGYAVDVVATDLARAFFTPHAIVDGKPRDAVVRVMRGMQYPAEALAKLAPVPPPTRKPPPPRTSKAFAEVRDAVAQWNADRPEEWPRNGGSCPACGHNGCFGQLPGNPDRWCCFSSNHEQDSSGCGLRTKRLWIGDALDLEAQARRCSRREVLLSEGYLSASGQTRPGGQELEQSTAMIEPRVDTASSREEPPNATDVGNADRFAQIHRGTVAYCFDWKHWLVWDGKRWARDRDGRVQQLAKAVPRAMLVEATRLEDDPRAKLAKHALLSEHHRRIAGMVDLARSDPTISALPERFDGEPTRYLLNIQNGTIDLRSGRLLEHRREHFITKLALVAYDPAARCPLWEAFLTRVVPDPEVREFLQRYAGSALTADADDQVFVLLLGLGANGKSTFVKTLMYLLGDYARWAAFDTLLEAGRWADRRGAPRPDLMALRGARLVAAIEAGEGRALDEATIKMLTGGDGVSARGLYQDQAEWTPEFKLILSVNHEPLIRSTDSASWRRPLEVPFDVTIPRDEQEPDLHLRLREPGELSGILNWALAGCFGWQENPPPRLAPPAAVIAATSAYQIDQDVLGPFITARCELEAGAVTTASELWKAYKEWCEAEKETPMSRRSLGGKLRGKGCEATTIGHKKTRAWSGIKLRQELFEQ